MLLGVDSARPVTPSFFAQVVSAIGKPSHWWRYLGSGDGAASPVTRQEVDFLHSQGVAVGLVYNDAGPKSVAGPETAGRTSARLAVREAHALGVPKGTLIVADVEAGWSPTAEWVTGWAREMVAQGFGAGFYAAEGSTAFATAYAAAAAAYPEVRDAALWVASWTSSGGTQTPMWQCKAIDGHPARVWQAVGNADGGAVDIDEAETLAGLWLPPKAGTFADVPATSPYAADIATVAVAGLMEGTALGRFDPDAPMTRAEMATVVARIVRKAAW